MKIFLTIIFSTVILYSCNCHHEGSGFVLDQITKKPLANVRIDVYSTKPWKDTIAPSIYTDENGHFEYAHDYCYDMMQAYLPNYTGHVFSSKKCDTVYLEYNAGN